MIGVLFSIKKFFCRVLGQLLFFVFNRLDFYSFQDAPVVGHIAVFFEKFRTTALRLMGASIGKDSIVRAGFFVVRASNLSLGNGVKIARNAEIWNYASVSLGNSVEVGSGFVVHTEEHLFENLYLPLAKQGELNAPVVINDDVYIGSGVTILSGCRICSRVVLGAGAVVTKTIQDPGVYCGIPARLIKPLRAVIY